jgi:hypothetical protein
LAGPESCDDRASGAAAPSGAFEPGARNHKSYQSDSASSAAAHSKSALKNIRQWPTPPSDGVAGEAPVGKVGEDGDFEGGSPVVRLDIAEMEAREE